MGRPLPPTEIMRHIESDEAAPTGPGGVAVGQVIDSRYEILELVGQGGMGTVYKARHVILEQIVAFKVIHTALASHSEMRERFLGEARAAMRFSHPNAIAVRDFGITRGGMLYMTLDYSTGVSLKALIAKEGCIPEARSTALVSQCLQALKEAHAHGIVHRDLKPDNVLVERSPSHAGGEHVRICDFGLAKIIESSRAKPGSHGAGAVVGTPFYMAPEQAAGDETDARTDLYAMGCILYELVTGTRVFDGETASKVILKHITRKPELPSKRNPKVSHRLETLIMQALEKDPAARPQSADEFLAALNGLKSGTARSAKPMRVLLAEDNLINRRITKHLLERWGHVVEVVTNGHEALTRLDAERFDLVVMDGQMPVLDGFDATRRLRAREAASGDHLPVIGITGDGTQEIEDRCHACGMDANVSKPIDNEALFNAVERFARAQDRRGKGPSRAAADFDRASALARFEGDRVFLGEVVTEFASETPRMIEVMREALKTESLGILSSVAHELKGAAGNCAAMAVHQAASELEAAAIADSLDRAREHLDRLDAAFERLGPHLQSFLCE